MGKFLKLCVLAMTCTLAFGCTAKHSQHDDGSVYEYNSTRAATGAKTYNRASAERFRRSYEAAFDKNQHQGNQQLLRKARSAIGSPYVPGGTSPNGFDCSGLVCWAYKSVGVNLPRTAREQSVIGQRITNVNDMRAGDIVAFRHPRRGYHTGIYVGDGKFIHSPRRRTNVRVNSLDDPYFKGTFLGARRVNTESSENFVAQAESRISDFTEEKVVRELSRGKQASGRSKANAASRSKSRDKVVQVASNERSRSLNIDVQKADRQSRKQAAGNDRKADNRKKADTSKAENRKPDNRNKVGASRAENSKSGKASAEKKSGTPKVAAKAESGKSKKPSSKNRENKS